MTLKQKLEESVESFDSFFAGLAPQDEKNCVELYEKYIADWLTTHHTDIISHLKSVIGEMEKEYTPFISNEHPTNEEVDVYNSALTDLIKELDI